MDPGESCERKMAIQGHGVSSCCKNYELMTTPVSICSVIAIVGPKKVVLLHADSSIKAEDVEEIVKELEDDEDKEDEQAPSRPKVSYVCSSKPGYIEQWTDIMEGLLPEFCYPQQRSSIMFSGGKFSVCSPEECTEDYYHLPKVDMDALVDTECLWASLYFTDSIRFGPVILDSPEDLQEGLVAAGKALSAVHLLSFDGAIKEVQVDAFLRRYWKTTILGRFLEEFAPSLIPSYKGMTHLSVAEVLEKDIANDADTKKVEDIVVDYGILILSFLDTLKSFTYPTNVSRNLGTSTKETGKKSVTAVTHLAQQSKRPNRSSQQANVLGASLFEESFGNIKIGTSRPVSQTKQRRESSLKVFEKKR